jgi:hypothetical protein
VVIITKIIYFHSADTVEIMDAEQNGKILTPKFLDENFYVSDEVNALKLVKRNIFGKLKKEAEPLYICYSDAVVPAEIPKIRVENREPVQQKGVAGSWKKPAGGVFKVVVTAKPVMELTFKKTDLVDPRAFKNTMELAILGNLLKPKMKLSGMFLLFLGVIIGFAVVYLMGSLGYIHFVPLR